MFGLRLRLININVLIFIFSFSYAQQFGGTPSSIKWKQINTDTIRVIFPAGFDSIAARIATVTTELQKNHSATIGNNFRKVNIVLQSLNITSNAYVALGPYHSEFDLMPPQDALELGAQNWADNLAIHEFRHVEQYSNFNIGLSKAMSVLFGENGQALANGAAIPDWFFEGDAVYNETLLSKQGRGRLPQFFNGYKSLYQNNKHYNYMQLRNGSFKNYIPDHYQLGYLLVAYGREKYGNDFWLKVTHDAASFKPLFYPLQKAVEKYTGLQYDVFVRNAMGYYEQQWSNNTININWLTNIEKDNVVDYKYPYKTGDGAIIVLKKSYKEIPTFYKINSDKSQTKIAVKDIPGNDDYFSYNNGKIIYTSLQPDIRWGNRDFSILQMVDVSSGETKKVSTHTKYFSPDISHDSKSIVAVNFNSKLQSSIEILNTDGELQKQFNNNAELIYSYPKFSFDDKSIFVFTRNNKGEMGIEQINIADGSIKAILKTANRILGFPVVLNDTLLYSCSNNGKDETWAYILSTDENYRLATFNTGLYQASLLNTGMLAASAFTSNGYRLAIIKPVFEKISAADTLKNLYVSKPFNSIDNNVLNNTGVNNFVTTNYPKLFRPFNFHSWNPYLNQPDYSFIVYGENVLNTFESQVYYNYNSNEKYSRVGYTGIYGGWYLQPLIDINHTWNRRQQINTDTTFTWNELNAAAGFRLPLNLSGGKQYRNLNLTATYNIDQLRWTGIGKQLLTNLNFNYAQLRLTYNGQIQRATQQILPRWAQSFLLQYRTIITNHTARQFLASASVYLPAFAKTHGIVLNAAYQSRDTANQYFFSNNFPFSRGYTALNFSRLWKLGANYHLPLFMPDWGFGNIVFIKRVRANIFFDYTKAKNIRLQTQYNFRSTGAEIYFDTKWWNQQPVTFGIRYSNLLDNKIVGLSASQWEFILPVALY